MREQVVHAPIDFYALCVQDADDREVPVPWPEEAGSPGFLTARSGRLDLRSAGHTHTARLTAQIWDRVPSTTGPQAWDEEAECELLCVSGRLVVRSMTADASEFIDLGRVETRWRVRVRCVGRVETGRRTRLEGPVRGVERYLFQFWPAGLG